MLKHWLIDLIGHVSGLTDGQLRQVEKSLPASNALIDLLIRPPTAMAQRQFADWKACTRPWANRTTPPC